MDRLGFVAELNGNVGCDFVYDEQMIFVATDHLAVKAGAANFFVGYVARADLFFGFAQQRVDVRFASFYVSAHRRHQLPGVLAVRGLAHQPPTIATTQISDNEPCTCALVLSAWRSTRPCSSTISTSSSAMQPSYQNPSVFWSLLAACFGRSWRVLSQLN